MREGFVERHGRLTELDRSFDLKFWQDQPAPARFAAAAELSDTDPHGLFFDLYPCLSVKIRVPNILADCANAVG